MLLSLPNSYSGPSDKLQDNRKIPIITVKLNQNKKSEAIDFLDLAKSYYGKKGNFQIIGNPYFLNSHILRVTIGPQRSNLIFFDIGSSDKGVIKAPDSDQGDYVCDFFIKFI